VGVPTPDYESDWTSVVGHETVDITHSLNSYGVLIQAFVSSAQTYENSHVLTGDVAVRIISENVIRLRNVTPDPMYVKLECWLIRS
jgi:hypothetical protein